MERLPSYQQQSGMDQLAELLVSREKQLAGYLKSISHPSRLSILIHLITGKKKLSDLDQQIPGSKTALSNHITILRDQELIEKEVHGYYTLSDTGLLYLESLGDFVSRMSRRPKGAMDYLLSKPVIIRPDIDSNQVKHIPRYQDSYYSLIASVTGIIQSFGEEIDVVDVLGYSGQGFLAAMTRGRVTGAPATAHPFLKEVHQGIESMGFELVGHYKKGTMYPQNAHAIEEEKRLITLFETVKDLIDRNNPVILWGPHTAEFAIVYGYEKGHYLVQSYKSARSQEEIPIHYKNLHLPGGIWYYFFGKRTHQISERQDREAIRRALTIARGRSLTAPVGSPSRDGSQQWAIEEIEMVAGPPAFEIWEHNLENRSIDPIGNALMAACYHEGYERVAQFLKRLGDRYQEKSWHQQLMVTSQSYEQLASTMQNYCELFPFPPKNIDKDQFEMGIVLMRKSFRQNAICVEELEKLCEMWK